MTDLQKQIEELKTIAKQDIIQSKPDFERGFDFGSKRIAEKAISIIKQLQDEINQLKGENNDE